MHMLRGTNQSMSEEKVSIKNWEKYLEKSRVYFEEKWNTKPKTLHTLADYNFVKTIGTGAYGRVVLAKLIPKEKFYAIKIMEKETICKLQQLQHALNEKRILQSIDFPFLVKMEGFFKDNSYIYIVMPFVPGGEMFSVLRKVGKFSEPSSKFYAAQVVLALEYLHYLHIVYRDLKPENLLLCLDGYLKITDLGFCKVVKSRTYTLCGTPEYLAPEMILSHGHGLAVDWWALGVLLYEMTVGSSPFYYHDQIKMFKSIAAGYFNSTCLKSIGLREIVKGLLETNPSKRLGCMGRGAADVKEHQWFRSIRWLDILNKSVEPPYVPRLTGPGDSSHYKKYKEEPLLVSPKIMYEKEFADF